MYKEKRIFVVRPKKKIPQMEWERSTVDLTVFQKDIKYRIIPLEIKDKSGNVVAHILFRHYKRPVDFFYLSKITVKDNFRGLSNKEISGVGGSIVYWIGEFLKRKNAIGVLENSITLKNNTEFVQNLYEEKGWKELPGSKNHKYFSENRVDTEVLKKIAHTVV